MKSETQDPHAMAAFEGTRSRGEFWDLRTWGAAVRRPYDSPKSRPSQKALSVGYPGEEGWW